MAFGSMWCSVVVVGEEVKNRKKKMVPLATAHDREGLLKVEKEIWCIECRINFYILDKS